MQPKANWLSNSFSRWPKRPFANEDYPIRREVADRCRPKLVRRRCTWYKKHRQGLKKSRRVIDIRNAFFGHESFPGKCRTLLNLSSGMVLCKIHPLGWVVSYHDQGVLFLPLHFEDWFGSFGAGFAIERARGCVGRNDTRNRDRVHRFDFRNAVVKLIADPTSTSGPKNRPGFYRPSGL